MILFFNDIEKKFSLIFKFPLLFECSIFEVIKCVCVEEFFFCFNSIKPTRAFFDSIYDVLGCSYTLFISKS